MKALQKAIIYDLLKKASIAAQGYVAPDFLGEAVFFDDEEIPPSKDDFQKSQNFESATSIEKIARLVAQCKNCPLSKTRRNAVPGEGVLRPAVLVIGEAPGADEDESGRPFVGRAGQLLDKMLIAIKLERKKNCFITNIVKCRPENNRDPAPEECAACAQFLKEQIRVLKPKMILALGRIALQKMLDTSVGITKMHGKFFDYDGIPFMATFHPSALLRDESLKSFAWEDLKIFRARLLQLCTDYEK